MKLISSQEFGTYINGYYYEIIVENYKTVTHVYYKKVNWAYWSNVITLKGKNRNRPIIEVIQEDLNQ